MSIGHNPKVVTSGLVFSYDMDNNKKSWKGAPTANLAIGRTSIGNNNVPTTTVITTKPDGKIGEVQEHSAETISDVNRTVSIGSWSLTSDLIYTLSFYVKNLSCSGFNGNLYSPTSNVLGGITYPTIFTDRWTRVTRTFTVPSGFGSAYIFSPQLFRDGGLGKFRLTDVQLEQNSFATPYINGTRSNTQAILDLKNNNTITPNSLTYNSDGTFSFNGSNTYASFNNPMSNTGPYTVIQWLKPSSALIPGGSGVNKPAGTNRRTSLVGPGPVWSPGIWMTSDYIRCHAKTQYVDASINWTTTTWNMIGMTYDGTNCQIIFNGGFLPIAYTTSAAFADVSTIYLGAENSTGSSVNWLGNIGITQIYNRVLTTTEILQNYNALKGRFVS